MADPQDSTSNGHAEALLDEPSPDIDDVLDEDDFDDDVDRVSPIELGGEEDEVELDADGGVAFSVAPAPVPANGTAPGRVADAELVARIQRLEQAAQALADAELSRDGRRVKRKVKAATGGAGIAALIPVVLQLAGAFDLSPELVSGITAAVALIGAFAAGWSTPERKPSLPSSAVQSLLDGARM